MMQLIPNWKATLKKAWSMKLIILAAIVSITQAQLPYLSDYLTDSQYSFVMFGLMVAAGISRLLTQNGESDAK